MSSEFIIADRTPKQLEDLRYRFIKVQFLGLIQAFCSPLEDQPKDWVVGHSWYFGVLRLHRSSSQWPLGTDRDLHTQSNTPNNEPVTLSVAVQFAESIAFGI
jgi:hypothetical protein